MDAINNDVYSERVKEYKKIVEQLNIEQLINTMLIEYNKKQGKALKKVLVKKEGK